MAIQVKKWRVFLLLTIIMWIIGIYIISAYKDKTEYGNDEEERIGSRIFAGFTKDIEQLLSDYEKETLFKNLIKLQSEGITKYPDIALQSGPSDWTDPWYCDIRCKHNEPCQYKDEVDFRIIVMTYNRTDSLQRCLKSIFNLETLGDKVSVEIWIDRSTDGAYSTESVSIAKDFINKWTHKLAKGRACYHIHEQKANVAGQWVDSWRSRADTQELALMLEDHIDISQFAYQWIKSTHQFFKNDSDVAGYSLQMENNYFVAPITDVLKPLKADKNNSVFLYPVIGTLGFVPHPKMWRKFQDWYHTARPKGNNILTDLIKPHMPDTIIDCFYNSFLQKGTQETMWEIWFIKFTHDYKLFTVYSNMRQVLGKENICLSHSRNEDVKFENDFTDINSHSSLLRFWNKKFTLYPQKKDLVKYNYNSDKCTDKCCFSVSCRNEPF